MNNQFYDSLKNNLLFKNSDITSLNLDEVKGRLIRVGEGEIVYRDGTPSDSIYLIISGQINIIKKKVLGKAKSYVYKENEFFGNDEYFEETTRTSTAIALVDSYLIILSREEMESLIFQDNEIFLALRENLSGLFDNSTEINVADEDARFEPEPEAEIEKVITGDEIERGIESIAMPSAESSADLKITGQDFDIVSFEKEMANDIEPLIQSGDASFSESDLTELEHDAAATDNDSFVPEGSYNESIEKEEINQIPVQTEITPEPEKQVPVTIDDDELDELSDSDDQFSARPYKKPPMFPLITKDRIFEKPKIEEPVKEDIVESPKTIDPVQEDIIEIKKIDVPIQEFIIEDEKIDEPVSDETFEIEKRELPVQEEIIEIEKLEEPLQIENFEPADLPPYTEEIPEPVKIEDNFKTENSLVDAPFKPELIDETGGEMNKDEVTKIINAMELVNSTVKIDDLLTSIVNVACDLTNADRGTLYLVDKEKGELWSKIATGGEPKEIRLKIGEGIAGAVAKSKKIENIKDVSTHPMFKKDVDRSSGYVTKNMLCFPLKNKEEEVIGVLQLLNSKSGEFSTHDEEVLSMISINTAIALQNADLVEKLLTAERVSSLGKMTNFLIQDIKKPVLVSKRYTEHLKSKSLAPEVTQLVEMILTELTQVADLVQTTSSYAEGKTILRTTVTGINAVLQDFIGRTEQYVLGRHCKINFDPDKEFNVKVDSKEFFQCFQHIVKNACDAMPDGGTLSIKTKIDGRTVKLIFEDQGLGIPESFIDKIFEPFMTHGKKEGAGLGLSITKKIVEAHQGTIEVRSSLGAGAAFTITLPAGS